MRKGDMNILAPTCHIEDRSVRVKKKAARVPKNTFWKRMAEHGMGGITRKDLKQNYEGQKVSGHPWNNGQEENGFL